MTGGTARGFSSSLNCSRNVLTHTTTRHTLRRRSLPDFGFLVPVDPPLFQETMPLSGEATPHFACQGWVEWVLPDSPGQSPSRSPTIRTTGRCLASCAPHKRSPPLDPNNKVETQGANDVTEEKSLNVGEIRETRLHDKEPLCGCGWARKGVGRRASGTKRWEFPTILPPAPPPTLHTSVHTV